MSLTYSKPRTFKSKQLPDSDSSDEETSAFSDSRSHSDREIARESSPARIIRLKSALQMPRRTKGTTCPPELRLCAAVIMVFKMAYGLDGRTRTVKKSKDPSVGMVECQAWISELQRRSALFEENHVLQPRCACRLLFASNTADSVLHPGTLKVTAKSMHFFRKRRQRCWITVLGKGPLLMISQRSTLPSRISFLCREAILGPFASRPPNRTSQTGHLFRPKRRQLLWTPWSELMPNRNIRHEFAPKQQAKEAENPCQRPRRIPPRIIPFGRRTTGHICPTTWRASRMLPQASWE